MNTDTAATWKHVQEQIAQLKREMAAVIVGQDQIVELMLVALLCRGHCLIVGVPGLAKTLLVSTLAKVFEQCGRQVTLTGVGHDNDDRLSSVLGPLRDLQCRRDGGTT